MRKVGSHVLGEREPTAISCLLQVLSPPSAAGIGSRQPGNSLGEERDCGMAGTGGQTPITMAGAQRTRILSRAVCHEPFSFSLAVRLTYEL